MYVSVFQIILCVVCITYLLKIQQDLLSDKIREQQSWKQISDESQHGLLILNNHHRAFYQNTAVTNIFGSVEEEETE